MSFAEALRYSRFEAALAVREGARRALRWFLIGLGLVMMVVGVPLALAPLHLGVPLLLIGLIVVLRNSIQARREFIKFQRRHPGAGFPLRRLLRREPEVLQVAWQQALRLERLVIPARLRFAGRTRRALRRRWRAARA